ncbi:MAG: alanine racemase [Leptospiraceae bacterium]|nr:alanine racemase [Leptospiraceae bacterium]MCB1169624.1 alanine racemase [Leptospiraceae bacterium]
MNTWLEISRGAVEQSVMNYRKMAPGSAFFGVVKSNAYGHGLQEMTEILKPLHARGDVSGLAVNAVFEALALRSFGYTGTVLIMGRNGDEDYRDIPESESDFHMVLSTVDDIRALQSIRPLPFHLKVDTGMSRLGLHGKAFEEVLDFLSSRPSLPWRGLMTHFANVEDVMDQGYGRMQLARFEQAMDRARAVFRTSGFTGELICHSAASAPAMLLPESRQHWIRVGISLYGFWPSSSTRLSARTVFAEMPEFRPALAWKSRVVHINRVEAGTDVGYGCTFRTPAPTTIAVIPVGYYEGYDRSLSNRAHVLIRGKRAQILGRVCMNMIMVDVTSIPECEPGDVATLIGLDGQESISADELADLAGTINYEVVTRIEPGIPRIIVD